MDVRVAFLKPDSPECCPYWRVWVNGASRAVILRDPVDVTGVILTWTSTGFFRPQPTLWDCLEEALHEVVTECGLSDDDAEDLLEQWQRNPGCPFTWNSLDRYHAHVDDQIDLAKAGSW